MSDVNKQCEDIRKLERILIQANNFWKERLEDLDPGRYGLPNEDILKACSSLVEKMVDVEIMLEQMKEQLHCRISFERIKEDKLKEHKKRQEMNAEKAIERLNKYKKYYETSGNCNYHYDIELHNICIKALEEMKDREPNNKYTPICIFCDEHSECITKGMCCV